ncbi:EutN/CcmL family microcompartment protein [Candidatus Sumerlaeota bacterium]|nr:EutN/CcmL family microcompartment protein [Candidatus Sumerlaeota bacterium]
MKLGRVIGRVTLNKAVPSLKGGRYVIVSPMSLKLMRESMDGDPHPEKMSNAFSPVVYDAMGAWTGQIIGYVEGREAAAPFEERTPVDAINVAIMDRIELAK